MAWMHPLAVEHRRKLYTRAQAPLMPCSLLAGICPA